MSASFKSYLKATKIGPRKSRLVVNMIRGKNVQEAGEILKFTNKKAAKTVGKVLQSALATATQEATVDVDNLYVAEAYVDEGPMMKRFLPRAQGRATPIRKRSSHITLIVKEK